MKISTTPRQPETPAPTVVCAHCGIPVNGQCALFIHVGDNPPHGRPSINVIGPGFQFCSPEHRALWWEVPATEPFIADPALLASPHVLSAMVVHGDDHTRHLSVFIEDDTGAQVAEQWGLPAGYHTFEGHEHLESWWRGEVEAPNLPLPMVEEAEAPVVSGGGDL